MVAVLIANKSIFCYINTNKHTDKYDYSMVYDSCKYNETDFALAIHYNGFVVNSQM